MSIGTVASRTVRVARPEGLHARPASEFCQVAARLGVPVTIRKDGRQADAASVLEVLGLDVRGGDEVTLIASPGGDQAKGALEALVALLAAPPAPVVLRGTPASAGTGWAPAWVHRPAAVDAPPGPAADVVEEEKALRRAVAQVRADLTRQARASSGEAAEILAAQATMAADPALLAAAARAIRTSATPAARAVIDEGGRYADTLEAGDNPVLAERAQDIRGVCQRIARALLHLPDEELDLPSEPSVVVADDLTPPDTARLDPRVVRGLATARGSRTSHTAILARSLGVPAVVAVAGLAEALDSGAVRNGTPLGVDGDEGLLHVDPEAPVRAELHDRATVRAERARALRAELGSAPTATGDGHVVRVSANIRSVDELHVALLDGAEGVGLLRTELLYLDRREPPGEDEQTRFLGRLCDLLGDRPLVVRTFDIGADKPARFLPGAAEANPELGVRGIRLAMRHPELLDTQLRAAVRAARGGRHIGVMAPMVATVAEADWFLERVRVAGGEGLLEVGVMVEVPSAVLLADELASRLDFLSIGTNDLTQYLHAADRRNPELAALQDPFSSPVLRAVQLVCEAADRYGIRVAVCGEAAADPQWAVAAVGLGVRELSMQADALLAVRAAVKAHTLEDCRVSARQLMGMREGGSS